MRLTQVVADPRVSLGLDQVAKRPKDAVRQPYPIVRHQPGLRLANVCANGGMADVEQSGDFLVFVTLNHEADHLRLARR